MGGKNTPAIRRRRLLHSSGADSEVLVCINVAAGSTPIHVVCSLGQLFERILDANLEASRGVGDCIVASVVPLLGRRGNFDALAFEIDRRPADVLGCPVADNRPVVKNLEHQGFGLRVQHKANLFFPCNSIRYWACRTRGALHFCLVRPQCDTAREFRRLTPLIRRRQKLVASCQLDRDVTCESRRLFKVRVDCMQALQLRQLPVRVALPIRKTRRVIHRVRVRRNQLHLRAHQLRRVHASLYGARQDIFVLLQRRALPCVAGHAPADGPAVNLLVRVGLKFGASPVAHVLVVRHVEVDLKHAKRNFLRFGFERAFKLRCFVVLVCRPITLGIRGIEVDFKLPHSIRGNGAAVLDLSDGILHATRCRACLGRHGGLYPQQRRLGAALHLGLAGKLDRPLEANAKPLLGQTSLPGIGKIRVVAGLARSGDRNAVRLRAKGNPFIRIYASGRRHTPPSLRQTLRFACVGLRPDEAERVLRVVVHLDESRAEAFVVAQFREQAFDDPLVPLLGLRLLAQLRVRSDRPSCEIGLVDPVVNLRRQHRLTEIAAVVLGQPIRHSCLWI